MFTLARLRNVVLGWVGASVFFTVVLEISELGRKRLGFALYSNAVHFALWALTLPVLAKCIQRFPLKDPHRIRNGGICLVLVAALAPLVAIHALGHRFPDLFPISLFRSHIFRSAPEPNCSGFFP